MTTRYIVHSRIDRKIRAVVGANNIPVEVLPGEFAPIIKGERARWETKGGTEVLHPNAYAKTGWSNMVYCHSTRRIDVSVGWLNDFVNDRYPSVVYAGHKFFVLKPFLRKVERILSKYERHLFNAPKEKFDMLMAVSLDLIKEYIAFAEVPGVKIPYDKKHQLLLLGERPAGVARFFGAEMSNADAKRWIKSGLTLTQYFFMLHEDLAMCKLVKEPYIAQWMLSIFNDESRLDALFKERDVIGPHGEIFQFQYINFIDEVRACDLVNGLKSGVESTFKRAAKRRSFQIRRKVSNKQLAPDPDWWPGDSNQWKILRSSLELYNEGKRMEHCVVDYAPYVSNGESIIVSINGEKSCSTVEFDSDGSVLQHLGFYNSNPSDECKQLLQDLSNLINENKNKIAA